MRLLMPLQGLAECFWSSDRISPLAQAQHKHPLSSSIIVLQSNSQMLAVMLHPVLQ